MGSEHVAEAAPVAVKVVNIISVLAVEIKQLQSIKKNFYYYYGYQQ